MTRAASTECLLPLPASQGYVSNEAPPQTDQWPRVIQGCLWLIWASVRPRFVRIAASRRVGLEKLLDLKPTPALQSGQRQNRGSPEPENPEAAIEATNLTRSDPTQALGINYHDEPKTATLSPVVNNHKQSTR